MEINYNKIMSSARYFILVIIALMFLGPESVRAQEGSKIDPRRQLAPEDTTNTSSERALPYFSPKKPVDCEVANFYIDDVIRRWQENNNGSYLIVIARLGHRENSRQLNLSRLKAITKYLNRYPDTKLITAEGGQVNGYGCLEFYVNGKRLYVIPIIKNANIDLFSCNGV